MRSEPTNDFESLASQQSGRYYGVLPQNGRKPANHCHDSTKIFHFNCALLLSELWQGVD